MRIGFLTIFGAFVFCVAQAQRVCSTLEYQQELMTRNPSVLDQRSTIEKFTRQYLAGSQSLRDNRVLGEYVIRIPVVVHILYHDASGIISDDMVHNQIAVLNRDFQRKNADTVNTPVYFRELAAACPIEFVLATVDPKNRATTGIIRKYTPVKTWVKDDKIKFTSEAGDDAWDARSYFNIWVGQVRGLEGYSSVPGDPAETDGVVINTAVFGNSDPESSFNKGRTLVHETGHWLGLRHLWGDTDCGDDLVDDTPQQRAFTPGCPSGKRITCGSTPYGDMYMNYMDFTNDACINLFTRGQVDRMMAVFAPGGARESLLRSNGLGIPLYQELPVDDGPPRWMQARVYPNPAGSQLTLNLEYDTRWIGKELIIVNSTGVVKIRARISSALETIDVSGWEPGVYFIRARKNDEQLLQKFVKL